MSPGPRTDREKNTDKTTKLLSAVLILFLVAEFPQVPLSRSLHPLIYYSGHTGHAVSHLWPAVLHGVLQPCWGDDGHDGPHQWGSKLYPLLSNVLPVLEHSIYNV